MTTGLYVGLMSGTSVDSVDAALVLFNARQFGLIDTVSLPYEPAIQRRLLALKSDPTISLSEFVELDHRVARTFAQATNTLLQKNTTSPRRINAIGSHGQTIFHLPDSQYPGTLQIGDPNLIAALTGIDVIADFRRADMAVGGQGAPLAPAFHQFALGTQGQVVINLGGIANITVLHKNTVGFDTGPANALLDECAQKFLHQAFDTDGAWGRTGQINQPLLERLLQDNYFKKPPPKSTGTDYFNLDWVYRCGLADNVDAADLQRTLVELTAITVAESITDHQPTGPVYVCGGGLKNQLVIERIQLHLGNLPVKPLDDAGVSADACECCTFAWLAHQHINSAPGNLPQVTGASQRVVLGALYPAPR